MNIHFIAIGGSVMHSLAIELKNNGHTITGSDDIIYDPAKSNLKSNNLLPSNYGWYIDNIHSELDMVILGMHAKKDNPELLEAQKKNIPTLSFPEFISRYSIDKKRVVIAGSHGKTTITGMIMHVLNDNKIKFDYLVGAKIDLLDKQVNLNNNDIIIIEGDEYLSSAIDATPKFLYYNPDLLVVSGVAWDHFNVFPTLKSYQNAFKMLLNQVLKMSGKIFYCDNDDFLNSFLKKSQSIHSYSLPEYLVEDGKFHILHNYKKYPMSVFGKHNLYNLQAANSICNELGINDENFYLSIQNFNGASKRLSLIKNVKNKKSSIYYDFAHSPSKVSATINALRELHPTRYLLACLELHTFSSLSRNFLPNYSNVFLECDEIWIYIDSNTKKSKELIKIRSSFISETINHHNIIILKNKESLEAKLKNIQLLNTNLLLMSSGNFSGINLENIFTIEI
ncbi:MAG: peptidoglycan synthetase [Flavobacteriales bacterium]|nr:peptidoglycan synthetase [Flavobacteriales bacterium]